MVATFIVDRSLDSWSPCDYNDVRRRRSALVITDTELALMASAATMGLRSKPNTRFRMPAAVGDWRAVARDLGIAAGQIERMTSAFVHADLDLASHE